MAEVEIPLEGWRDLAAAIPGVAAVQFGAEFVYVSEAFAETVGVDVDALLGEDWQILFGGTERARIERTAMGAVRENGRWQGEVRIGGDATPAVRIELSLSHTEHGAIVWSTSGDGPAADDTDDWGGRPNTPRSARPGFPWTLLDTLDDIVYVIDAEGQSYAWNQALAETTGYSHGELAKMQPKELIPEDQHEYVPGLMEAMEAIEDRRVDVDILTSDGERITHEFRGTTFEDPVTGEIFRCGVARDVTEVRRLERELREEHRFVENVVDALDDVLYVVDEDGRFAFWNVELCERFGYDHQEVGKLDPRAFLTTADHDELPIDSADIVDVPSRRNVLDLLTKDEKPVPHELYGTTYTDEVTGDRYRVGVARDVTGRLERERELERYETIVETVQDGIYALDENLRISFVNDALCEIMELSRDELLGTNVMELFVDEDEADAAAAVRERVVAGETDFGTISGTFPTSRGERKLEARYQLHPESDGEFGGSVGVIRDVTEREERERALERHRDELATLDRINELLLATAREIVESSSREAVERTVCERLAASPLYQFAWIGEREFDGDRIVSRTSAGEDPGCLDADGFGEGDGHGDLERSDGPGVREAARRAMDTGEVVIASVADSKPGSDADGLQSAAAVPLRHGETVYGVLVLYAGRESAFSDREESGFDVIGRTVGFVIHAARSRELLFADTVVELAFDMTGTDSMLVAVAADLECEISLEGYVRADEQWIVYLDVADAPPGDVLEAVESNGHVEGGRVITDRTQDGRIELIATDSSVLQPTTAAGATVQTLGADPDGARMVVESAADVDARAIVEHVREANPGVELLAHREHDREVTTVGRPGGLLDDLTDRQREVLEAAYRAGYYAWTRESTAEDVAESLGIAPPTLHAHLRKAERTILNALLEE